MRNTPYVGLYPKGVEVRLKDRRVIVMKTKDGQGYRIETAKIDRDRYWKPAKMTRIHNAKVVLSFSLSKEAMSGIIQAVRELENNPHYK